MNRMLVFSHSAPICQWSILNEGGSWRTKVWSSIYNICDLLDATAKRTDSKPIPDMKEKIALKVDFKKIDNTDIEKLLKEYPVLYDIKKTRKDGQIRRCRSFFVLHPYYMR